MRRKAFTLIELLVVIGIIGILVTMLLPELARIRRIAFFSACKGNLKGIGTAMLAYQQQSSDRMPVYKDAPESDEGVNNAPDDTTTTDYTLGDPDAPNEDEIDWTILKDQAMQNAWLLVMAKLVDEEMFRCKGDDRWEARGDAASRYGWTDAQQYSYGMQWPYAYNLAGDRNKADLGTANTALMADMTPIDVDYGDSAGVDSALDIDPSNHAKMGTNLLLASGGVKSYEVTANSNAGTARDDIYTAGPSDGTEDKAGYMPGSITTTDKTYEADEDTSIAMSGRGTAAAAPEP